MKVKCDYCDDHISLSNYGKNKKMAHEVQSEVSPIFLPHFDLSSEAYGREINNVSFRV